MHYRDAVLHLPGHQIGRSPDRSPVGLFIGPTRTGALIEVLVERRSARDIVAFHALVIDDQRLRRTREMRRKR